MTRKFSILYAIFYIVSLAMMLLLLDACANRGNGPQGGPKDLSAPVVRETVPLNKAVNVPLDQTVIELKFDEVITLKDAQKIVVSPAQLVPPEIKAYGRLIRVTFDSDSLLPNTTYSIDFDQSIVDNNEGNPLKNYRYCFSTGSVLDSLEIAGHVIRSSDLFPQEGLVVGVYADLSDSVFFKQVFTNIATTKKDGSFTLRNLKPGKYRIYALNDVSSSYRYSYFGTDIAFLDEVIVPEVHVHGTADTIWKNLEKTSFDTILFDGFSSYYPKDILLKTFKEEKRAHYFKRAKRLSQETFVLTFSLPTLEAPVLRPLNFEADSAWCIKEKGGRLDSLVYWINDTSLVQQDTLLCSMRYVKTDSLFQLTEKLDTIKLLYKQPRKAKKQKKSRQEEELPENNYLFTHNVSKMIDVYDSLAFYFEQPIEEIDKEGVKLFVEEDTVWVPAKRRLMVDDEQCPRKLYLFFKKDAALTYRVQLDSAAIRSKYGKENAIFYKSFRVKSLESYANLYLVLPSDSLPVFVELMNASEQVIRTGWPDGGEVAFEDLPPGKYFARLIVDANNNGKWDTGDLLKQQQAEEVYYMPKQLKLRANWDLEETWNYTSTDILKQRPRALKKKK